jgi:hypothetical protein
MLSDSDLVDPASFRDPSGFVFYHEGVVYRQVNRYYRDNLDLLMSSGLYRHLVESGLMLPHADAELRLARTADVYKILRPEPVPFISYPYEWCFSQLQDAALATLAIQKRALEHGMCLKDAAAYNIQFVKGRPVLIDTLSFEIYRRGQPWVAYRQFCQHFLAPLALMSFTDVRLNQLARVYVDGIPLDLASRLLPRRALWRFSLLTHIVLHAQSQRRFAGSTTKARERHMSKGSLLGLVDNLESAVRRLVRRRQDSVWGDYYKQTTYSPAALEHKKRLVQTHLERIKPGRVLDLGANTGVFSRLAASSGAFTVAFDADSWAVEQNYLKVRADREENLLPLVVDLVNPSPDLGWGNRERRSALGRSTADAVMALALVHHMAIAENLPLPMIADLLADLAPWLIIEFVPKSDPQTQRLLASREDIFSDYTADKFESAFGARFVIESSERLIDSERTLYLMRRR